MAAEAGQAAQPRRGSVWAYRERNGTERWAIGHPSFGTGAAARTARSGSPSGPRRTRCATQLVDAARGELVEPRRQPLGDYLDEWAAGLRLAP